MGSVATVTTRCISGVSEKGMTTHEWKLQGDLTCAVCGRCAQDCRLRRQQGDHPRSPGSFALWRMILFGIDIDDRSGKVAEVSSQHRLSFSDPVVEYQSLCLRDLHIASAKTHEVASTSGVVHELARSPMNEHSWRCMVTSERIRAMPYNGETLSGISK